MESFLYLSTTKLTNEHKNMHKNYLKSIVLSAIISVFAGNLSAQGQGSMGVEVNGGLREYLGDMGSSLFFKTKPNYQGAGAAFTYGISPSFDGVVNLSAGDVGFCRRLDSFVKERDIVWQSFRANTGDLTFGLRYKLNNGVLLSEDSKFAPYLYGGFGAYYVHSTIIWGPDPYVAGTRVDQWGGKHLIQNTIQDIGAQVQGGLGFKLFFSDKIALHWSYVLTYTFNDRWDGANSADPNPDKPLVNGLYRSNDAWGYNNIGIAFALNEGSGGAGHGPRRMKDTDEDGVPDKYDRCKGTEAKYRKYVDSLGCPADTDGDGILDADDKCPEEKGSKEMNGCPDTDGDGIENKLDACPTLKGLPEFNGCPDTDGDGIADNNDACPNEKGSKEMKGCPDTDGDGIPNSSDKCPTIAGTASNNGCPVIKDEVKAKIKGYAKGILFETNKAVIVASSNKNLDEIVKILTEYPEVNIEIQGHTDNVGDAVANKTLSQNRADAVKAYFIGKGVNAAKLKSIGYGSEMPIADNTTAKGKEANRRVDFILTY